MREDGFVAQLRELVQEYGADGSLIAGIGDDAAVWQPSRSHRSVITTDALVDGVHFRVGGMSAQEIGYRALASNLSDIAAMGARPVLATVALGVPPNLPLDLLDLYRGMLPLCAASGCALAGGDVTRAPTLLLSVTVVGEIRPSRLRLRSGVRPGDVIAVTGPLGASRAGLDLADNQDMLPPSLRDQALAAHRRPEPRLREGAWLAAGVSVRAMMDISDGLSTDAARLAHASGCAIVLEGAPVAPAAEAAARAQGLDPQTYALAAGEDFELLVAVKPRAFAHLAERFFAHFRRPLIGVGTAVEGAGLFLRKGAEQIPYAPSGWDHLR